MSANTPLLLLTLLVTPGAVVMNREAHNGGACQCSVTSVTSSSPWTTHLMCVPYGHFYSTQRVKIEWDMISNDNTENNGEMDTSKANTWIEHTDENNPSGHILWSYNDFSSLEKVLCNVYRDRSSDVSCACVITELGQPPCGFPCDDEQRHCVPTHNNMAKCVCKDGYTEVFDEHGNGYGPQCVDTEQCSLCEDKCALTHDDYVTCVCTSYHDILLNDGRSCSSHKATEAPIVEFLVTKGSTSLYLTWGNIDKGSHLDWTRMPTAFRISYMNEDSGDLIFYESGIPHYNTYCGQKIIFKEYTETGAETKNLTVDLSDEKFMPGMVYRFAVQTYNRFGFSDYSRPSMAIYIPDRAHKSPKEGNQEGDDDLGLYVGLPIALIGLAAIVAVVVVVYLRKRKARQNTGVYNDIFRISGDETPGFTNSEYFFAPEQIAPDSSAPVPKTSSDEFPRDHIRFLNTLGRGSFGEVMHAQALIPARKSGRGGKSTWVQVAIKRTLDVADAEAKQDFLTELSLLRSVPRHSNIVTLYAQCTAREPYLMILEFAPHKDLSTYLQRQRKSHIYSNTASQAGVYSLAGTENGEYTLPWGEEPHYHNPDLVLSGLPDVTRSSPNAQMRSRDLISFAFQTCRGLQHLVNNKIVHRDVAARNLLLFDHGVVKISDFGLARKMDQRNVYVRSRRGLLPLRWMSPEAIFFNLYTEKSDVWSFGVFLWELTTLGLTPYPGLNPSQVMDKIKTDTLLEPPSYCSPQITTIMTECWRKDAEDRPTFAGLCRSLETLLETQTEYVDLSQLEDPEYCSLGFLED